ncbi:MAG: tetratricopeptide repeat protein, partial [Polyangia bacterium]
MRRAAFAFAAFFLVAPGCRRVSKPAPEATERSAMRATHEKSGDATPTRPLKRCFEEDASGDPARPLEALLDRAADRYDHGDFQTSLVCAEEAARVEPRSVEAHHDRAAALQEIGRLDEAESAFTRALALDPDDPETLAGAADLYINRLPPTNDHTETGLEFARRGSRRLKRVRSPHGARPDRALVARLALLEGQALNDLGRSREALMRLDAALAAVPDDLHARYERAVALFDLCRFAEARRAFNDVLVKNPHDAWAHHHLGLTLERLGDVASADRELARARTEAPAEFHSPVEVSQAEFRALVDGEAKKLPTELRADLGRVNLETADLPDLSDLTAEEPPLAPTILGLFRGAPIGEAPEAEARAIVIYRKNLA